MKSSPATGESKQPLCPNLTMITSGIILLYSLLFFPICPSPDLAFAIGIEFALFLLFLLPIRHARTGHPLFSWPQRKLDELRGKFPLLTKIESNWRKLTIFAAFTMILAALIDLTALWLAVSGLTSASVSVYSALPVSYLIGNHPALSLEMLTGACVESHQLARAESLYLAVLNVRKNVYGPTHPMVAALYADLGDLNKKMHRDKVAQQCYRASMTITEGHGRALHSLANLLRDGGDAQQSKDLYERALELRAEFFGRDSQQYQTTLHDYQSLTDKSLHPPAPTQ